MDVTYPGPGWPGPGVSFTPGGDGSRVIRLPHLTPPPAAAHLGFLQIETLQHSRHRSGAHHRAALASVADFVVFICLGSMELSQL